MTNVVKDPAEMKAAIRQMLSQDDLLDGLVEELAELQQACMKVKRTNPTSRNPTTLSFTEAADMIMEELGDVLMYIDALGWMNIDTSDNPKWARWFARVTLTGGSTNEGTDA